MMKNESICSKSGLALSRTWYYSSERWKEFYLYHAYNRSGSVYVGRQGVLEELCWGEDGWPYFRNDAVYNRPNLSLDYVDSFKGNTLAPIWQWRVTQKIDYQTRKNGLHLGAMT